MLKTEVSGDYMVSSSPLNVQLHMQASSLKLCSQCKLRFTPLVENSLWKQDWSPIIQFPFSGPNKVALLWVSQVLLINTNVKLVYLYIKMPIYLNILN